ncbi:hypothetical protein G9A89_012004 [Geosiphon pyriformis]|nr:hypothetical protein G9A89_012004 [Geosiphon pyriformis]
MESFETNKNYTIRSVLECLFHKMVLDHLVVNDELVLKPGLVKSKSMKTQSPIFAIGSVIEDALEKDQELWLVLQNMQKTYDLVDWKHLEKTLSSVGSLNICEFSDFVSICNCLFHVGSDSLSVYTDSFLKNLGMIGCQADAVVFFEDINLDLSVSVCGLVSSTLAKLQAITLALECVLRSCSVCLFSDSQAALDACKSELNLMHPDFCNWCWVEHQHISNIIYSKNLRITWRKVKSHSGILENNCANSLADTASLSGWFLSPHVSEHFLVANGDIVSGNSRHFVQDVFCAVCHVHWEVGSGSGFLVGGLLSDVNWFSSFWIWHLDLHMVADFTSRHTADTRTYFMKTLHY